MLTSYVTGNYFQALGVEPLLGRLFRPERIIPGADPVIVLSYAYWQEHFAGDPNILGRQVAVNGQTVPIIGVTPRNFYGLVTVLRTQIYLPAAMIVPVDQLSLATLNQEDHRNMRLYARLQPGVSLQQANATLSVVARRLAAAYPRTEKGAELRTFPLYAGRLGDLDSDATNLACGFFLWTGRTGSSACLCERHQPPAGSCQRA